MLLYLYIKIKVKVLSPNKKSLDMIAQYMGNRRGVKDSPFLGNYMTEEELEIILSHLMDEQEKRG